MRGFFAKAGYYSFWKVFLYKIILPPYIFN